MIRKSDIFMKQCSSNNYYESEYGCEQLYNPAQKTLENYICVEDGERFHIKMKSTV